MFLENTDYWTLLTPINLSSTRRTFMKTSSLILASLGLISSVSAFAAQLEADPAHSSIGFDIKHLMISTVHGQFTDFAGTVENEGNDLTKSKVRFNVKSNSINTANAKRDEHLRSADFFDVQKYPEASFVSSSIKKVGTGKYRMEGDLTIRGMTKKAVFDVTSFGKKKDPWGNEKVGFQAVSTLNRKDYGLNYNQALETGGVLLGEQVKLIIDLQAVEKPLAPGHASK